MKRMLNKPLSIHSSIVILSFSVMFILMSATIAKAWPQHSKWLRCQLYGTNCQRLSKSRSLQLHNSDL